MKHSSIVMSTLLFIVLGSIAHSQWVQTNSPCGGYISTLTSTGTNLFAGMRDSGGIFLSTDNGTSWTAVNSGLTDSTVLALAVSGANLFAGTFGSGGAFLSTNNGTSWNAVNNGLPQVPWDTLHRVVYTFAVSGTNIFAGTIGGVLLSTNNGTSWTAVNTGLPTRRWVQSLAINTSGEIFVALRAESVFKSTDNGASWTNTGCPVGNGISPLAINASGHIFFGTCSDCVGCPSGVFRSTDDGASWNPINTGALNNYVAAFAVSRTNLFASTGYGVDLSTDGGTIWTETGLTRQPPEALAVSGTNLFAGTLDGSVWRRPLSEMVTSVPEIAGGELPGSFGLNQNYPNPFNPSTTIRYGLPNRSQVTLNVFNTLGQHVATLVNGDIEAGYHEVQFDAGVLASGVYFYRLEAGSYSDTKRFMILK